MSHSPRMFGVSLVVLCLGCGDIERGPPAALVAMTSREATSFTWSSLVRDRSTCAAPTDGPTWPTEARGSVGHGVRETVAPPRYTAGDEGLPVKSLVRLTAPPKVSTELEAQAVRSAVQSELGQLRSCHESALARNPSLAGHVIVALLVGWGGVVQSASFELSTLGEKAMEDCIATAFRGFRFPAPKPRGPAFAALAIEFALSPAEQPARKAARDGEAGSRPAPRYSER